MSLLPSSGLGPVTGERRLLAVENPGGVVLHRPHSSSQAPARRPAIMPGQRLPLFGGTYPVVPPAAAGPPTADRKGRSQKCWVYSSIIKTAYPKMLLAGSYVAQGRLPMTRRPIRGAVEEGQVKLELFQR